MTPNVTAEIKELTDRLRAIAHETIRNNQQLSNLWLKCLWHETKLVEIDFVYADDSAVLLRLVNELSDDEFKALRSCADYSSRRSHRFSEVDDLLKSIRAYRPDFQVALVVVSAVKTKPESKALVLAKRETFDLTANDRRLLRSLRIGPDGPPASS